MRIAVLDADMAEANQLCKLLSAVGYTSVAISQSGKFLNRLAKETFDLVLLAWNLPDISAINLLSRIRQGPRSAVPVMIMSSNEEATQVAAMLGAGADDYVVRPVSLVVLLARVDALLRRTYRVNSLAEGTRATSAAFEDLEFEFDFDARKVVREGEVIALTQKEFYLAVLLFRHLNRPVSRAHILEAVWHVTGDGMAMRTADTHISALRSKLGLRPERGYRLVPLYGYGYMLERLPLPKDLRADARAEDMPAELPVSVDKAD